ncbi:MAG: TatD family hydrolase, partial [Prevotella sp.]|nr:TatD family hydrolase [Prevotella sp.]
AEAFDAQLGWAFDADIPVIIHCREGLDTILDVFEGRKGHIPQCVFHSFGGNTDDVTRIRLYGDHYFGINGIVTFKNSRLREVLPAIGIDRILLETDSPYLAPVHHRGKRNESAFLIHTAAHVAQSLDVEIEEVEHITTASACRFFGIET